MTGQEKKREFRWRIIGAPVLWALFLFPGMLIGPIHLTVWDVPLLVDPVFILEILGGILFGIWGGMISPLLASSMAFAVNQSLPVNFFVGYVLLQIMNGTIIPWLRHRVRRSNMIWHQYLVYCVTAYGVVPLVNGLFYATTRQLQMGNRMDHPTWQSMLVAGLGFVIILVPGEALFRFVVPVAHKMGIYLKDRWGHWSQARGVPLRMWTTFFLILFCGAVPVSVALVAQEAGNRNSRMVQETFIATRYYKILSQGEKLSALLQRRQKILELSAWIVKLFLYSPGKRSNFLLDVLKSHRDILNLEYIPLSAAGARLRFRYFVREESALQSLDVETFYCSNLKRSPDDTWFYTMGVKVQTSGGSEHGWLFVRYDAKKIQEMFQHFQNSGPPGTRLMLTDRYGNIIYGDDIPHLYVQRNKLIQLFTGKDDVPFVLIRALLHPGQWEMVYLEEFWPADASFFNNMWSGVVHFTILAMVFIIAIFFRVISTGTTTGASQRAEKSV